jgi:3',5'-nucleoside bisphosphate phosphatase
VELAARAGLSWVAVTDHDTVAGLPEAQEAAERIGIGLVPGIELSVLWRDQDLHLLAYWVDPMDSGLLALLDEIGNARIERAKRILRRLHGLGVNLPFEALVGMTEGSRALGRPHVARALLTGGWVGSFGEAFARYLGSDAPAYVPKEPVDLARAFGVLRGAGGVPVLAHPGAYRLNGAMKLLVDHGLEGLETEYPKRSVEEGASLRRLAERHGLAMTGGSDFHGAGISDVTIGAVRIDARAVDVLAARKEEKR